MELVQNKDLGFVQEALVAAELLQRGFRVSVIQGGNAPYDLISDWDGKLSRIQVKSTMKKDSGLRATGYRILALRGRDAKKEYTKKECDYIIAVIAPKKAYYIIPIENLYGPVIRLYPDGRKRKAWNNRDYDKYQNMWDLLK